MAPNTNGVLERNKTAVEAVQPEKPLAWIKTLFW